MYTLGHALEGDRHTEFVPAPEEGPVSCGVQAAQQGSLGDWKSAQQDV